MNAVVIASWHIKIPYTFLMKPCRIVFSLNPKFSMLSEARGSSPYDPYIVGCGGGAAKPGAGGGTLPYGGAPGGGTNPPAV